MGEEEEDIEGDEDEEEEEEEDGKGQQPGKMPTIPQEKLAAADKAAGIGKNGNETQSPGQSPGKGPGQSPGAPGASKPSKSKMKGQQARITELEHKIDTQDPDVEDILENIKRATAPEAKKQLQEQLKEAKAKAKETR